MAQGAVACRQGAYVHQRGPPPLSLPGDACPELPCRSVLSVAVTMGRNTSGDRCPARHARPPLPKDVHSVAHISHSDLQERAGLPSLRQMGRCPWPGRWDFSK